MENLHLTWGGNFKSVTEEGLLEGKAIVFGSEEQPDQSQFKDFFTPNTYVHPEDSFITPLFFEHAQSYTHPIGRAIMTKTDTGWEATAELDMTNSFIKEKFAEIKNGHWGFSSGAAGHCVSRAKKANSTHEITQWPMGELSITKTPAEKRAMIHSVKSMSEYYGLLPADDIEMEMEVEEVEPEDHREEETRMINEQIMEINNQLLATNRILISQLQAKSEPIKLEVQVADATVEEIKTEDVIEEVKTETQDINLEELTMLKTANADLQSSLEIKEAELETQATQLSTKEAELEAKTNEIAVLQSELDKAKKTIENQKLQNLALAKTNYNV